MGFRPRGRRGFGFGPGKWIAEMTDRPAIVIERWAAAFIDKASEALHCSGDCAKEAEIPAGRRRRMGPMERLMARCVLGVLREQPAAEIILCSRYGNVAALASLLRSIAAKEPLSPMTFSLSVHNATAGLLEQIRGDRTGHTALAAGRDTLTAGLSEAYACLATAPDRPVALVFGDWPLPEIYTPFKALECGGTAMAWLMRPQTPYSPNHPCLRPIPAPADADPIEGAEVMARTLIAVLESSADLVFRGTRGPAWRLTAG
jgi:hypothetical protein